MSIVETDHEEFKTVSGRALPKDLWEPMSAFSNADGGIIHLGIRSDGKRLGVDKRYLDKLLSDVNSLCVSGFNHRLYPEIVVEEDNVVCVYIPPVPATLRPIYTPKRGMIKGGRIRIATSNMPLDEEYIKRFAIAARGGAELIEFSGDYHNYFDDRLIDTHLKRVKKKRGDVYKELTIDEILIKQRAVIDNGKFTLFGLLAYSKSNSLQELTSPSLNIAITQYQGTSKIDPQDASVVSIDDREFSGNVVSQFNFAFKFLLSKLSIQSRVNESGKRQEYLSIPRVAIREVLSNAIVHRDYTNYRGKVQIDIYTDRIEFANPGRSLIPLKQIDQAHSETRNPLLMNFLRDFKITEQRARGIRTIKNSLREAGLAEPSFVHRNDWFVATIYSSAFIRDDDQVWLQKFGSFKLNERQLKALVHLRYDAEGISNSEYRSRNNMHNVGDDIRAKKELKKMVDLGLVDPIGEKRYRRYVLSRKLRHK